MDVPSVMDSFAEDEGGEGGSAGPTPAASSDDDEDEEDEEEDEDDDGDDDDDDEDEEEDEDAGAGDEDGTLLEEDDLEAELEDELGDDGPSPFGLLGGDGENDAAEGDDTFATPTTAGLSDGTPGTALAIPMADDVIPGVHDGDLVGEDDIGDDDGDDGFAAATASPSQYLLEDREAGAAAAATLPEEMLTQRRAGGARHSDTGPPDVLAELADKRKTQNTLIGGALDDVQIERFEIYKRSKIKHPSMKKVVEAVAGRPVTANAINAMCGVTKVFVGEVVEMARSLATRAGHYGALQPAHLYEAYAILRRDQPAPPAKRPRRLFR